MRKLIVSMNVTLDGFLSGPNCDLDWHIGSWTDEMAETACEQLSKADTILFGRITYFAMARYWTAKTIDLTLSREDIDFAEMLNAYTKIVFSRTLKFPIWNNSILLRGNMAEEIIKLKQRPGKHIITYGSGHMVSGLIQYGLVDEYQIWVHPVLLGTGKPLFKSLPNTRLMQLCQTKTFNSGVVLLTYAAKQQLPNYLNNSRKMIAWRLICYPE